VRKNHQTVEDGAVIKINVNLVQKWQIVKQNAKQFCKNATETSFNILDFISRYKFLLSILLKIDSTENQSKSKKVLS
jgi:poly(A) polymerase Pap1